MSNIQVVLADDNPVVRGGIRRLLQKSPDIEVIGEASDGLQALRLAEELTPDVLVLDMEMPVLKGFQVTQKLRNKKSDLPVLALSAHEDKQFILGMLASGATGYLVKDEVPETIVRAVKGVANGEQGWISRRVAVRIAVWLGIENLDSLHLAPETNQLLHLFLKGRTRAEIASELGLSPDGVEALLNKIVCAVRKWLDEGQGKTLSSV